MTEYTATVGETLYTASTTEPHIVIAEDRTVIVPDELLEIAAQFDHNIETVTFDCPRYWDDHDFFLMEVFVNYRCADGTIGSFPCKPPVVDSEDATIIHFDWTISRNVTCAKGNISFLVCAKYSNKDGVLEHQWSSRLNQEMKVLEGFECDTEDVISENPDIIEQILMRLSDMERNGAGGSGVVSDTFIAKYGKTTIKEITDARENKKIVYAVNSDKTYFPYSIGGAMAIFSRTNANHTDRLVVTESGWAKYNTDLVSTESIDSVVSRQSVDETVPSTKAVYDFVLGDPCSLEVGFNRIHVLADTISADTFYVEKGTLAGIKEQILEGNSPKIKVRGIVTDEESHAEYAFLPSGHYYNFNAGNDYIIIEFIARFGSSLKEYTMKAAGEDIELNRFTEASSANIVSDSGDGAATGEVDATLTKAGMAADAAAVGGRFTQYVPTYTMAEGETLDDVPDWAVEVIDPYNDPEQDTVTEDESDGETALNPSPTVDTLGITGATAGQIVKVAAVDESGAPTQWDAVDLSKIAEQAAGLVDMALLAIIGEVE
jgi:hypothetical protein